MTAHSEDWVSIAEQASKEMDSAKLITLVQQLCSALDNRKGRLTVDRPDQPIRSEPLTLPIVGNSLRISARKESCVNR